MIDAANGVRHVVTDPRSAESVDRRGANHREMAADAAMVVAMKAVGMSVDAVVAMTVGMVPAMIAAEIQVVRGEEADAADLKAAAYLQRQIAAAHLPYAGCIRHRQCHKSNVQELYM